MYWQNCVFYFGNMMISTVILSSTSDKISCLGGGIKSENTKWQKKMKWCLYISHYQHSFQIVIQQDKHWPCQKSHKHFCMECSASNVTKCKANSLKYKQIISHQKHNHCTGIKTLFITQDYNWVLSVYFICQNKGNLYISLSKHICKISVPITLFYSSQS